MFNWDKIIITSNFFISWYNWKCYEISKNKIPHYQDIFGT